MRRSGSLSICIFAALMLQVHAASNDLKVIQLKQGCRILCPKDLSPLDTTNIEKIKSPIPGMLKELRPKLKFEPNPGTTLLLAADNPKTRKRQLGLTLGPPEKLTASKPPFRGRTRGVKW